MRVGIDDIFFKKERNQTYADWESSLWRELFQNSIDQGADQIRITLSQQDTCVRVTFFDNGPGMPRDVLEKVYFAIGATTKTGTDQIGGMGRARILTCFSMPSYLIRSDDYLVIGHGGEYEVAAMPKLDNTCTLIIDVDDTSIETLHYKLKCFLEECHISATIFIDDKISTIRAEHLGRHNRDLTVNGVSFAKVYINKSVPTKKVIVRVNGVSMYTTDTDAPAQIVIELSNDKARAALTSNRDSLKGEYRKAFNDFLRELSVDVASSLRPRFISHTRVTRGGGFKIHRPKQQPVSPGTKSNQSSDRASAFVVNDPVPIRSRQPETPDTFVENPTQQDRFGKWLADTFGDIFIYDETENATMHKAVPNFLPENWQQVTINNKTHRKGANISKVLLMWQTAVVYAIEQAMEPLGLDYASYGVGFIFADDRLAEKRQERGGHLFLLRPVTQDGKLDYKVSDKRSLKRLMTLAKHEVAHIAVSWHSEAFSSMREKIDTLFDEAECFRRMKSAIDAVPDFDS